MCLDKFLYKIQLKNEPAFTWKLKFKFCQASDT